MKCKACGYSEAVGAVPSDMLVKDGDMIPMGKCKFVEINGVFSVYEYDKHGTISGSYCVDLYACPSCGTVRIDNDQR